MLIQIDIRLFWEVISNLLFLKNKYNFEFIDFVEQKIEKIETLHNFKIHFNFFK